MNSLIYTEWDLAQIHLTEESFPLCASLSRYYILYWDYSHFISQLRFSESGPKIFHQGIIYSANLHSSQDWRDFSKSKRVCLSFRAWKDSKTCELTGVVLVKRVC